MEHKAVHRPDMAGVQRRQCILLTKRQQRDELFERLGATSLLGRVPDWSD